ncbi:MAG: hypothetical protein K8I00_02410, partial [Candidatus Omnitrophica bacterium]|nr:hypothetical protein [Candidatus Omnitrophota bacterium]
YAQVEGVGAGELRRAKLVADAIVAATPADVKVRLYVNKLRNTENAELDAIENERIEIIEAPDLGGVMNRAGAGINIGINTTPVTIEPTQAAFTFYYMLYSQGSMRKYDQDSIKTNQDLADPYGTIYLNRGLFDRKLAKDAWTPTEYQNKRQSWLESNIPAAQRASLNQISQTEGWDVTASAWTSGYFQDANNFMKEMDILKADIQSSEVQSEIFADQGKQVLVHLVPGSYAKEFDAKDLTERGFNVILPDGQVLQPQTAARVPVTVMISEGVKNSAMKTLVSEAIGTFKRSEDNNFWSICPRMLPAQPPGSKSFLPELRLRMII